MTQVKFNNEKWWVLLNPPKESDFYVNQGSEDGYFDSLSYEHALELSWVEIAEKDWEKVKILIQVNEVRQSGIDKEFDYKWLPTPDQIYSLPNEVEFEITRDCKFNDGLCEYDKVACKCKKVAHLKDNEPKKEQPAKEHFSIGISIIDPLPEKKRSEEVKKEPEQLNIGWKYLVIDNIDDFFIAEWTGEYFKDDSNGEELFQIKTHISIDSILKWKDSQSEIESLCEELGLLKIGNSHIKTLLESCEKSLREREDKIKELENKLAGKLSPKEEEPISSSQEQKQNQS